MIRQGLQVSEVCLLTLPAAALQSQIPNELNELNELNNLNIDASTAYNYWQLPDGE